MSRMPLLLLPDQFASFELYRHWGLDTSRPRIPNLISILYLCIKESSRIDPERIVSIFCHLSHHRALCKCIRHRKFGLVAQLFMSHRENLISDHEHGWFHWLARKFWHGVQRLIEMYPAVTEVSHAMLKLYGSLIVKPSRSCLSVLHNEEIEDLSVQSAICPHQLSVTLSSLALQSLKFPLRRLLN